MNQIENPVLENVVWLPFCLYNSLVIDNSVLSSEIDFVKSIFIENELIFLKTATTITTYYKEKKTITLNTTIPFDKSELQPLIKEEDVDYLTCWKIISFLKMNDLGSIAIRNAILGEIQDTNELVNLEMVDCRGQFLSTTEGSLCFYFSTPDTFEFYQDGVKFSIDIPLNCIYKHKFNDSSTLHVPLVDFLIEQEQCKVLQVDQMLLQGSLLLVNSPCIIDDTYGQVLALERGIHVHSTSFIIPNLLFRFQTNLVPFTELSTLKINGLYMPTYKGKLIQLDIAHNDVDFLCSFEFLKMNQKIKFTIQLLDATNTILHESTNFTIIISTKVKSISIHVDEQYHAYLFLLKELYKENRNELLISTLYSELVALDLIKNVTLEELLLATKETLKIKSQVSTKKNSIQDKKVKDDFDIYNPLGFYFTLKFQFYQPTIIDKQFDFDKDESIQVGSILLTKRLYTSKYTYEEESIDRQDLLTLPMQSIPIPIQTPFTKSIQLLNTDITSYRKYLFNDRTHNGSSFYLNDIELLVKSISLPIFPTLLCSEPVYSTSILDALLLEQQTWCS